MDKRKLGLISQIMALCGQYSEFNLDDKFYLDQEVTDCKFKLYILLLTIDKEEQDKNNKEKEKKLWEKQ
ncbi:MAG: hypothetical protein E7174_00785 [Firmicutes bacterium]|nr:hypothetical protein [Bacillota bacterium]